MQSRRWALVAATTALIVAGCGQSDEPESAGTAPPKPADSIVRIKDKGVTAKGGTVDVLNSVDWVSLDPANNYSVEPSEIGRLIYRTLTFIKDTPGEELSVQPDLAESLGTSSDGGKTWTYKLREGVKYEDGKPITAADVKYGVQRSFAQDVYDEGATYMVDLLENETEYAGPYTTPEKDLTSVETPDDRTLVFHFKGPQPDADWILSQLYTAPVPKAADTKEAYADRPVSSGPYKIEKYTPEESLVLVRNDQWDAAADPNRPANPDRFQFFSGTPEDTTKRLLAAEGADANAVALSSSMSGPDASKLEEPSVEPRFINGPGPCVDYVAMNTQKISGSRCPPRSRARDRPATDSERVRRGSVRLDRRFVHPAVGCGFRGAGSGSETPRRCRGREEAAGRKDRSPVASGAHRRRSSLRKSQRRHQEQSQGRGYRGGRRQNQI